MAIADKLKNIRKAKKDLADKFYINEVTPLADFVNLISNTEDIKLGIINADKNFKSFDTDEVVAIDEFYDFAFAEDVVIPEPERVENQTYSPAKLQNILDAKNAIKTKFGLGDVLANYAETIPTGDSVILGHVNEDKNFQDLVFYDKTGVPKNAAKSAEFYRYIQSEIDVPPSTPLTFTAERKGAAVTLNAVGSPTISGLQYRTDVNSEFTAYDCGTAIHLSNVGDIVQFRNTEETLSTSPDDYVRFSISGKVSLLGNIQSMLNFVDSCKPFCYKAMFAGCTGLTTIPAGLLPAKTLAEFCYNSMFNSCTGLTTIPEGLLPATSLANDCYDHMFYGCTGLTTIPEGLLPAKTLAEYCYHAMFLGCTSLTTIPAGLLPAKTLAKFCYTLMFYGCTGLTSIPEGLLPAKTLAGSCYRHMFWGCTGLTSIPEGLLPATSLADDCYSSMFAGCTGLTTIPEGLLPATSLANSCYNTMFTGCTGLTTIPEGLLPATTLADICYIGMFAGCTGLTEVSVHFTAWLEGATVGWLDNVAANGTFKCPAALNTTVERGDDTIPEGWTVVNI